MSKIDDQFTHLPVSRQRKWQLRHPEHSAEIKRKYETSEKRRIGRVAWYKRSKDKHRRKDES